MAEAREAITPRLMMAEQPASPGAAAVAHYVTDEAVCAAGLGRPSRALCGRVFVPACLVTPLGRTCSACAALQRSSTDRRPSRPPRARALRRLLAVRRPR